MKKFHLTQTLTAVLLAMCLLLALAGCSKMENVQSSGDYTRRTTAAAAAEDEEPVDPNAAADDSYHPATVSDEAQFREGAGKNQGVLSSGETVEYYVPGKVLNPGDRTVTLFIWHVDSWKTVQWHYRDTLTVAKLLDGLQHETNWNLSTSAIKLDTMKCTIWWNEKSSLYTGFPAKQNKEYIVFELKDLYATILDSVKKTINENLGPSYSIHYANTNGGDLVLKDVGVRIPVKEPFSSFWDY
ncbi:MAG: hypothetical protein ILO43_05145 [Clostridia bacterium]|nr:hypothetical protein [Clostridia bacterium]